MLISGAEVRRVEEGIRRMCCSFGAKRTDVFIITSGMMVTVFLDDGSYFTQTRRVVSMGTDQEKSHRLNHLLGQICDFALRKNCAFKNVFKIYFLRCGVAYCLFGGKT